MTQDELSKNEVEVLSELDTLALEVLYHVHISDGETNTTKAKTGVGCKNNKKVKHRFKKLRDVGLGKLETGRFDPDTGTPLPNKFQLTDHGRGFANRVDWDALESSRPDSLREQYEELSREHNQLEDWIATAEEKLSEVERENEQLREENEALKEYLVDLHQWTGASESIEFPDAIRD